MNSALPSLQGKHLFTVVSIALAGLVGWASFETRSMGGALLAIVLLCVTLMRIPRAANAFLLIGATAFALALGEFSLDLLSQREESTMAPESDYTKSYYWVDSDLGFQGYLDSIRLRS